MGILTMRKAKNHNISAFNRGFTVIEMMTVVAVVGIVSSLAVPEFSTLMKDLRLSQTVNDLQSSMIRARSEAQRTNAKVSLCRTGNIYPATPACGADIRGTSDANASSDWSHGWLVYTTDTTATAYDSSPGADTLMAAISPDNNANGVVVSSNSAAQSYLRRRWSN